MGIAGLVQVAARHLGSYVELVVQAAAEYQASFRRRLILAAAAAITGLATLVALWSTGLALLWDTQWRLAYCLASVGLCLAATIVLATLAQRPRLAGPYTRALREEATQDLALLQEWRRAQG